jgi:hypothetical protein
MAKNRTRNESREKRPTKAEPASYFLSLSLRNVRCFGPEQTLDLSDGNGKPARWTIILGVNGTGKTTLLQSLVSFECFPESDTPRCRNARYVRFLTHWGGPQDFGGGGEHIPIFWGVKVASSSTIAAIPARVDECQFQPRPVGGGMGWESEGSFAQVAERLWCCAYGAGRRMGPSALSESGLDDPTASLFSDKADLRNPEEWLLRLDYAATKPSDVQQQWARRLAQVKHLLLSILPDTEDIRLTSQSGAHPTPRAEFKTPYGWVPLRGLGYGYQTLITWVTDLANRMVERYPDSPDPLSEPAVVAVDEIDLHLHPLWQRKLMGFLTERFPNTQFVATAHSPLVAQAAVDANLAVLRREGDHVVIDNDVETVRGWRIDQLLTSDLFGLPSARPPSSPTCSNAAGSC